MGLALFSLDDLVAAADIGGQSRAFAAFFVTPQAMSAVSLQVGRNNDELSNEFGLSSFFSSLTLFRLLIHARFIMFCDFINQPSQTYFPRS
jgi:hypothetical protein